MRAGTTAPQGAGKASPAGRALRKTVLYALLIFLALLTVFPFYWMFVLATHAQTDIFSAPPPLWFGEYLGQNYEALTARLPFLRNIWNSVYIALMATLTTLFFCSLGGFGFAMYGFRFKRALFAVLTISLMIPPLLGIIPYYLIIQWLGWLDTPRAVWFPGMASAFGIFLMRQYITSAISRELMDAARTRRRLSVSHLLEHRAAARSARPCDARAADLLSGNGTTFWVP